MSNAVRETVIQLIRDVCHPQVPDLADHNKSLLENGLDSLDFASVLMAVEEKFEIELPVQDQMDQVANVNAIVKMVEKKRGPT